eukprot:11630314-Ditylum_brightwellii.AAC.1
MGVTPDHFYVYYMATRLVAAIKQDPETLEEGKTMQYGCGEPRRRTELAFGVKAMFNGAEGTMIASADVKNGYNEIMHSVILEQVWEYTELRCAYFFFLKILSQNSYIGLGSGAHVRTAQFTCKEGVQQGAVEASFLFARSLVQYWTFLR